MSIFSLWSTISAYRSQEMYTIAKLDNSQLCYSALPPRERIFVPGQKITVIYTALLTIKV